MDGYIFTLEELENQGCDRENLRKQLRIVYLGNLFVRAKDLPQKFREEAIKLCQNFRESGLQSFIVETNFYLTVWQEQKLESSEEETKIRQKIVSSLPKQTSKKKTIKQKGIPKSVNKESLPTTSQASPENLRQYRGTSMDQEDITSPIPQDNPQSIQRQQRKIYRGQEYLG